MAMLSMICGHDLQMKLSGYEVHIASCLAFANICHPVRRGLRNCVVLPVNLPLM